MSEIRFRIAAKTDVGLERTNNEDDFQVSANLDELPMKWVNNQEYTLGKKGALLVVADGMGGMNAGEVASEIAISTVRECFSPENITDDVVMSNSAIEKFMKGVIVKADKRIKEYAKENPDSRSMGTTIVIAWLFDGNLYVSWCGDSRAYIYNPNTGLFQISKDHSYVQDLVDAGKISTEEAFDFPDSNIITRSLNDTTPKVKPDFMAVPQKLCDNDVILLCSDGLNGMIRDEEIEQIIADNQGNMTECVDSLIQAALNAAGADNCTVALCQILSGGAQSTTDRIPKHSIRKKTSRQPEVKEEPKKKSKKWLFVLIAVLCAAALGGWLYFGNNKSSDSENVIPQDSTNIAKVNTDSIEKAKKDSIEKACIDSIGKAKRDSIEKAVRDSLIRENDKKKALEAIKKTADKKKVDKKDGDNLPFDDMNEVQNSN